MVDVLGLPPWNQLDLPDDFADEFRLERLDLCFHPPISTIFPGSARPGSWRVHLHFSVFGVPKNWDQTNHHLSMEQSTINGNFHMKFWNLHFQKVLIICYLKPHIIARPPENWSATSPWRIDLRPGDRLHRHRSPAKVGNLSDLRAFFMNCHCFFHGSKSIFSGRRPIF